MARGHGARIPVVKTLVLVLSTSVEPFPQLIETIKQTWASVSVPEVDVLFYYGGDREELDGRDLYLPVEDDLPNVGRKTLACFEYVLDSFDFDLVYRTNCSTYIDLPNLRDYIRAHAKPTRFYAGKGNSADGIDFATGTGIFLSRDLVQLAVNEQSRWDHSYLDDVALAKLLHAHGVEREFAPRVVCDSMRAARKADTSEFHFRCKMAPTGSKSRRGDVKVMLAVHDAFLRLRSGESPRRRLSLPRRRA
jgi:hypothetical protein